MLDVFCTLHILCLYKLYTTFFVKFSTSLYICTYYHFDHKCVISPKLYLIFSSNFPNMHHKFYLTIYLNELYLVSLHSTLAIQSFLSLGTTAQDTAYLTHTLPVGYFTLLFFFLFFLAYPTGTGEPDPSRLLGSIVRAFLNLSVRARPGGTSPRSAGARRSRASRARQRALSVVLRVRSTLRVRLFFCTIVSWSQEMKKKIHGVLVLWCIMMWNIHKMFQNVWRIDDNIWSVEPFFKTI